MGELGRQPGAAGHDGDGAAAEPGLDLAADQQVERRVQRAVGEGTSALDAAQARGERTVEQAALPGLLAAHLQHEAAADDLEHAGHHGEDGGADGEQVGSQVLDAAAEHDLGTEGGRMKRPTVCS